MLTNTLGIFDISQSDELLEIHGHKSYPEKSLEIVKNRKQTFKKKSRETHVVRGKAARSSDWRGAYLSNQSMVQPDMRPGNLRALVLNFAPTGEKHSTR